MIRGNYNISHGGQVGTTTVVFHDSQERHRIHGPHEGMLKTGFVSVVSFSASVAISNIVSDRDFIFRSGI